MPPSLFRRLVRFRNARGEARYGELPRDTSTDSLVGLEVTVYDGDEAWNLLESSEKDVIKQLLPPLPRVPIYMCVGMNYKSHLEETKFPVPQYPVLFNKPSGNSRPARIVLGLDIDEWVTAAMAGPEEDVPVHSMATLMDYEGELCAVVGRDCKDLTDDDNIEDYILGYTVGNDLTSRFWQRKPQSGDQAGYSKSFDKFAPIGPIICSPSQIPDPGQLTLVTSVNGEERQRCKTEDLLFSIRDILKFGSVGHTIERGTVIMTGTPGGVAALMEPPAWLKHGDVVEVSIDGIGTLRNRMVFATP